MQKLKDTIENLSSNKRNEENFKLNARHLKHKIGLSLRTHCSTKLKLVNKFLLIFFFLISLSNFFVCINKPNCLATKINIVAHIVNLRACSMFIHIIIISKISIVVCGRYFRNIL
uniref:Uncharacterized protein n=1 Tax=Cacopsylla melanoneura TaxID=428564 RepID=A0A8D8XJ58_9HEMI